MSFPPRRDYPSPASAPSRPLASSAANPSLVGSSFTGQTRPSVAIDHETYQRFKDLEINHVTLTSNLEAKLKALEHKNEMLMIENVTKDSLYSELQTQKNKILEDLRFEQQQRMSERQLWNETSSQADFQAQQFEQLLLQLNHERAANQQMDAYLQRLNQERMETPQLRDEVNALRLQLEQERTANQMLDRRAMELIRQVEELKAVPPAPVALSAPTDLTRQIEELTLKLGDERFGFEKRIQLKQKEIADLHRMIEESEASQANLVKSNQDLEILKQNLENEKQRNLNLQTQLQKASEHIRSLESSVETKPWENYTKNIGGGGSKQNKAKPPKGFDIELWGVFLESDKSGAAKLDAGELEFALTKGPWPKLSLKTSWMLLRVVDGNGEFVDVNDFQDLWHFIMDAKAAFKKFDDKGSGTTWGHVAADRFCDSLTEMKIRMPKKAIALLFKKKGLETHLFSWDEYMQIISAVKVWLVEFEKIDLDGDRAISMLYDQYMINLARCCP